eukprot:scaffold9960_cov71-Phaeocystis_antarctica.AAC.7
MSTPRHPAQFQDPRPGRYARRARNPLRRADDTIEVTRSTAPVTRTRPLHSAWPVTSPATCGWAHARS